MGLLDKLVDKVIDSAKKSKVDNTVNNLTKKNPELKKAIEDHKKSMEKLKDEFRKIAKKKGLDL
tara:strand:- start:312 stop:503 length:192 start_codon:yes stop_codon:yes gene_type:complete